MTAQPQTRDIHKDELNALLAGRPIVLVGMMGAGKTTVGRRLAARLGRHFVDSDEEVEKAAGMTIEDIFKAHGEADFRAGEVRVIARLLEGGAQVIATGGGAFMNAETRARIAEHGVSVWLKADLDVLWERVNKRDTRPLLKTENPKQTLEKLMTARYPIYAEADLVVWSRDVSKEIMAKEVLAAVAEGRQESKVS